MTFFTKLEYLYLLLVTLKQFQQGCVGYDPEASITGLYTGPYFDPLAPRNLTAHLDDRAVLPCTVRQLGDKSVSWVRMRDADILTVDRYTFVSDERFEAHYSPPQETWNLVIKYVQERDAGQYECQVSTEPKMSQLFNLRVVVPRVSMDPPGDRYVKAGSKVRIDCQITDVVQQPDYIFWYHDGVRVLEHEDTNLQVNVKKTGEESMVSTLIISRVRRDESGNYTCMPSNLHASSILLHVLNEEHPEAMKDGRNASCKMDQPIYLFLLFVLCTVLKRLFNDGSLPDEIIGEGTKNKIVKKRCQPAFENGGTSETSVDMVIGRGKMEGNSLRVLVEFFRKLNQHMARKSVENIGIEKNLSTENIKTNKQEDIVKINLIIQNLIKNLVISEQLTKLGMNMILTEIEHFLPNEPITNNKTPTLTQWLSDIEEDCLNDKVIPRDQIIQTRSQANKNSNAQQLWTQVNNTLSCSHLNSVKMNKFR